MAGFAFLDALSTYLSGPAGLIPAPVSVGILEPGNSDPMPVIALSLSDLTKLDIGLAGGMTEISTGALEVTATIDLADPTLAGPDPVQLLDGTRTILTLPHGGLIRADGLDGALSSDDLSVTVDGAPVTLVAGPPAAGEMQVTPTVGQITFGTALPGNGTLIATYHLGIWERQTVTITGTLILDCWSDEAAELAALSAAAGRALTDAAAGGLPGLKSASLLALDGVSSGIGANAPRRRSVKIAFEYEHSTDRPVSSGGIIATIPITTRTPGKTRDPDTGVLSDTIAVETD